MTCFGRACAELLGWLCALLSVGASSGCIWQAGELLATLLDGEAPPAAYAHDETFSPTRWSDEDYVRRVREGQAGKGLQI